MSIENRALGSKVLLKLDREHVMRDLEPYLCTFGGCLRPAKTYGIRRDWIQHEIDVHQIEKAWLCRPCSEEFPSRTTFDNHMRERHVEFTRKPQLDAFADICQKTSDNFHSRTQCPLCFQDYRNDKKLRRYVRPGLCAVREAIMLLHCPPSSLEGSTLLLACQHTASCFIGCSKQIIH